LTDIIHAVLIFVRRMTLHKIILQYIVRSYLRVQNIFVKGKLTDIEPWCLFNSTLWHIEVLHVLGTVIRATRTDNCAKWFMCFEM